MYGSHFIVHICPPQDSPITCRAIVPHFRHFTLPSWDNDWPGRSQECSCKNLSLDSEFIDKVECLDRRQVPQFRRRSGKFQVRTLWTAGGTGAPVVVTLIPQGLTTIGLACGWHVPVGAVRGGRWMVRSRCFCFWSPGSSCSTNRNIFWPMCCNAVRWTRSRFLRT